ncbi:plasmid maintenance system antidote protein [Escherichia coli]
MLTEEFLKPLSMSHDELAEAMGICRQDIEDIIYGMRRLRDDEDFWSNLQKLQGRKEKRSK